MVTNDEILAILVAQQALLEGLGTLLQREHNAYNTSVIGPRLESITEALDIVRGELHRD